MDVLDAISPRALAGTPPFVPDSAASSQHARVPWTAGLDHWEPHQITYQRDVAVSVHAWLLAQGVY
jgi:hypothetical protein